MSVVEEAVSGDIIGLHNHGTIQIGDTFTEGEDLQFTGIPHFAPELFRRIRLTDPMKSKQLQKGSAAVVGGGLHPGFCPASTTAIWWSARWASCSSTWWPIVLQDEYKVEAIYEPVNVYTARWVYCDDPRKLEEFPQEGCRAPVDGWRGLPHLSGPDPGQSRADGRALAGYRIPRHPRALIGHRKAATGYASSFLMSVSRLGLSVGA